MHFKSLLSLLLFVATFGFSTYAAEKAPVNPPADYPLKTCVVSDEPLGSMGDWITHVHRVAGKPDRKVLFCCEGCIDDFKQDPAKFLKKLDDAAKAKGTTAKPKS